MYNLTWCCISGPPSPVLRARCVSPKSAEESAQYLQELGGAMQVRNGCFHIHHHVEMAGFILIGLIGETMRTIQVNSDGPFHIHRLGQSNLQGCFIYLGVLTMMMGAKLLQTGISISVWNGWWCFDKSVKTIQLCTFTILKRLGLFMVRPGMNVFNTSGHGKQCWARFSGTSSACRHRKQHRQHAHPQHHCVLMPSSLPS